MLSSVYTSVEMLLMVKPPTEVLKGTAVVVVEVVAVVMVLEGVNGLTVVLGDLIVVVFDEVADRCSVTTTLESGSTAVGCLIGESGDSFVLKGP